MGALAPLSHWIPEDDLLLKNAVEAGASLESLAKGAVRFSRRFTIRELQDRWYSLLYNESVAAKVADQIMVLEPLTPCFPKANKASNFRGKEWIGQKRNVESVRSHYYAKRKRVWNEPAHKIDLSFLVGPGSQTCNENESGNCTLGASVSNHFELPDTDFDMDTHTFDPDAIENGFSDGIMDGGCLYSFAEDVSPNAVKKAGVSDLGPEFQSDDTHKDMPQILEENLHVFSSPVTNLPVWEELVAPLMAVEPVIQNKENSVVAAEEKAEMDHVEFDAVDPESKSRDGSNTIAGGDFMDLSNSLLNFSTEEEFFAMHVEHKDYEGLNSLLLNSPRSSDQKGLTGADGCTSISAGAISGEPNCAGPHLPLDPSGVINGCNSSFNEETMSSKNLPSSKFVQEFMVCALNTEDPEIPDNVHIFLPYKADHGLPETNYYASRSEGLSERTEGCDYGLSQIDQRKETCMLRPVSYSAADRSSELKHLSVHRPGNAIKPAESFCQTDRKLEVDTPVEVTQSHTSQTELPEDGNGKAATDIPASDLEESNPESDDDIPYFSEVEAMILDMDLGPCDEDSIFAREVSRYQYEDTKKTIIRLEQVARASTQRAIQSRGALAVFYGRRLKHYITKPEVSIGRTTEDISVDIDLGREGRTNKVSRRQAFIKMEEDGSFYLTNLGKSSILVNSKEIASGQCSILSPSCLIEIRGMRFMFETNRNFMKPYATNAAGKMKHNPVVKPEWVPDDNPSIG